MTNNTRSILLFTISVIGLLSTAFGFFRAPPLLWTMGFFGGIAISQIKKTKK